MTHVVTDLASDRPNPPGLVDTTIKVIGPAATKLHGPMQFIKEHGCPSCVDGVSVK